jgi:protein ImuB
MSRIVSVWLPQLPIERLRREAAPSAKPPADRPFALVGSDAYGLTLTAINGASFHEGLAVGMRLADARAVCPQLLTAPAAPGKDADLLLALARWASRYSPTLNVDAPNGLWLDITGVAHLFGGESGLLAEMAGRFAQAGFSARIAAAETLGAAYALARFARHSPTIASNGALRASLAPLPVESLRLDPDTSRLLRRLGLKRIGHLYDLPRESLERRFHAKDHVRAVLHRLDQALGRRGEKAAPLLPEPDFVARLSFAEPLITHEGVTASLDRLAHALCERLAATGRGARRLELWAARTNGTVAAIRAGLSAPSYAPAHLVSLLTNKIETIDLGFGVDLMALTATATEPLRLDQTSLTAAAAETAPEALIDKLANRLGPETVRRLFPQDSHIPERAQRPRGAFDGRPNWQSDTLGKPPRPLFLLARPEPLSVMAEIPEGPPAHFTWRRVGRRVTKAEGPERIAPEWWRAPACQTAARPRDYYRIEDEDGCRYWVFRAGLYRDDDDGETPGWFLHGVFP